MRLGLIFVALTAACAPAVDDGGSDGNGEPAACDASVDCSVVDGIETCEPGYVFEAPGTDDFTCRNTGWQINDRVDPLDDSRAVNFTLDGPKYDNFVGTEIQTAIGLFCKEDKANIIFGVGTTDSNVNNKTNVAVRIGSSAAEEIVAYDSEGILLFEAPDTTRLANAARTAESVVLQFKPFQLNVETLVFDTSDLEAVTEPYKEFCNF